MTFYQWLTRNTFRADPIGDFARAAKADADFPRKPSLILSAPGPEAVTAYLKDIACLAAKRNIRKAWREYELWIGGPSKLDKAWIHGSRHLVAGWKDDPHGDMRRDPLDNDESVQ